MVYSPGDYIAVFDSGVGGVSVLRQIMAYLTCSVPLGSEFDKSFD